MKRLTEGDFFASLPAFREFDAVTDAGRYQPLPEGWLLATSDIVGSTQAIDAGRYKAVNMAGASVIAAVMNASPGLNLPFVFGGDGAVVAVPPRVEAATRQALAAVQAWVADEMGFTLRAGLVPVSAVRAAGLDVKVARFQPADEVFYAMFSGGGSSWAEAQMRAGRFTVDPAPSGTKPDLTGLSCRWSPFEARHGEILSVIAVPAAGDPAEFDRLVADIIAMLASEEREGHPLPAEAKPFPFFPKGSRLEARAHAPRGMRLIQQAIIMAQNLVGGTIDHFNLRTKIFDPKVYKTDMVRNSDFRKFDDGLKMTVDIDPARSAQIEALLEEASARGICRFGLHRQTTALMTCLVPTPLHRDHMHFIDGGSGGYAQAASQMKAKAARFDSAAPAM